MSICTIYQDIFSKKHFYTSIENVLKRISEGKSKELVEKIRNSKTKEESQELKKKLPAVCFSGKFKGERTDMSIVEYSGFIVLDFDAVGDLREKQQEIINHDFVYACWVSPSGNGLKALIKVSYGARHRDHFEALREIFPDVDKSGINLSRVCYESYDPEIYIFPDAKVFDLLKEPHKNDKVSVPLGEEESFKRLLKWLENKREAFVTGERNNFIFKLAASCCRHGIEEESCKNLIRNEFLVGSDFSDSECSRAIRSAYKANKDKFGDSCFENSVLVERESKKELKVDATIFDETIKPKDVIYGTDVKLKAEKIYDYGYEKVDGIGVPDIDERWKPKRGELTLLTGIGNAGKSTFKKWYQVFRAVLFGEKFGCFGPEDNPAEEYYHDLTEILLGADCTPSNSFRPRKSDYLAAYDFITKHFFYVYPESVEPTPEYIQERFLELIIKEKIDGCDIDPFNQLANKYHKHSGRDKYLEYFLAMFGRFAQINQVYFFIIAHPKLLEKKADGNYVCPDVFDVHDGSMWNNKMDNILVYHRPTGQTEPNNPMCEFHSKKIRRQKVVGKKGLAIFEMNFPKRRFIFNHSQDPMQDAVAKMKLGFGVSSQPQMFIERNNFLPYKDDNGTEINF